MKLIIKYRGLLLIVLLGFVLRFYMLGNIPNSLNPDEAALGYNAYSILSTGKDEHGVLFPLALQSFGDWKLPMYSYTDAIPVLIFGLTEFATRAPSALAGVIGIVLIYFIAEILFRKKIISYIAAFFFSVSAWSIYFSRAAYEVNVATTLFLAGLLCLLSYIHVRKKPMILFLASVFFSITLFTYHTYAIFLPLLLITIVYFYKSNFKKNINELFAAMIFLITFVIFFLSTLAHGSNKITTLNILNDPNIIYNRAEKLRGDGSAEPSILKKTLHSKYVAVSYQLVENYFESFSPSFLFDRGGEKLVHNLGYFGNLYLFDAILLLTGISALFWNRERTLKILIMWLLIAPIPSAITKDTPNSTRLFTLMPLFVLIASYGAYFLINTFNKSSFLHVFTKGILVVCFFINVCLFLDGYFIHFNIQRSRFWHYGYKQAVELSQKYPEKKVVMVEPENFPYIYFLFYEKYDPEKFQKEGVYYPPTNEGFYFVKRFGKHMFPEKIDYTKSEKDVIYIDVANPNSNNSIKLPSGEAVFSYSIK